LRSICGIYRCSSFLSSDPTAATALNHAGTLTQRRDLPQDFKLVVGAKRRELGAHFSAERFNRLDQRIVLHFDQLARSVLPGLNGLQVWSNKVLNRLPQAANQVCHIHILG